MFFSSFKNHGDWSYFCSFSVSSLNIVRYDSKTYTNCRTILMLLSTEGAEDVYSWGDSAHLFNRECMKRL